jgi:hypothetical protein
MDWVPGRTWGWLGPSGSLCNEPFIHSFIHRGVGGSSRGLQILPRGRFVSASGRSAFNAGGFVRSALLTVGDAMRAVRAIRPLATRDPYRGPWADADSELADLEDVLSALPQGWRAAAAAVTLPAPGTLEVFLQSDGLTPACFSRAPCKQATSRSHEPQVEVPSCSRWQQEGV